MRSLSTISVGVLALQIGLFPAASLAQDCKQVGLIFFCADGTAEQVMVDTPSRNIGGPLLKYLPNGDVDTSGTPGAMKDSSFLDIGNYGSTLPNQTRGKDFQGVKP